MPPSYSDLPLQLRLYILKWRTRLQTYAHIRFPLRSYQLATRFLACPSRLPPTRPPPHASGTAILSVSPRLLLRQLSHLGSRDHRRQSPHPHPPLETRDVPHRHDGAPLKSNSVESTPVDLDSGSEYAIFRLLDLLSTNFPMSSIVPFPNPARTAANRKVLHWTFVREVLDAQMVQQDSCAGRWV